MLKPIFKTTEIECGYAFVDRITTGKAQASREISHNESIHENLIRRNDFHYYRETVRDWSDTK